MGKDIVIQFMIEVSCIVIDAFKGRELGSVMASANRVSLFPVSDERRCKSLRNSFS